MRSDLERGSFGPAESLGGALLRAPLAAALADADGRLVAANQELGRLLGRAPETLVSLRYESLVHPADRPAEAALARALLGGEQSSHRGRCLLLTERGRSLEADVVSWTVPGGTVVRLESGQIEVQPPLLMRLIEPADPDRSDRSDEELALQLILDDLGEGVMVADTSGKFLLFNPKAEEILGLGPTEAAPDDWSRHYGCFLLDTVTPYPAPDFPLAKAIRGESVDDAEIYIRHNERPEGLWIGVTGRPIRDESGRLRGGVMAFRDRTEHKLALQALERSEARKAAILASMAEGVAITDSAGRTVSINPALEAMTGRSLEDVRGDPLPQAFPILDPKGRVMAVDEHFLTRAITTGEVVGNHGYAHTLQRRDGSRIPVAVTAAPVIDESGALAGGVQTIRDVSQERDVDERKSALVSTVSHELRSPLAVIAGYSEILLSRTVDEPNRREALKRINSSAKRLFRLIDDLLSVSRIESGHPVVRPRRLDVRAAVEEVVGPLAGDRAFALEIPKGLSHVMADPDMLVQILTNLVGNAVKYSEEEVTVSAWRDGAMVWISVSDRGIGLSEPEMAQLFGRFFRSERPEVRAIQGTGLGLSITRNLIELLGGEIRVESELDRGTTFRFALPVAPD